MKFNRDIAKTMCVLLPCKKDNKIDFDFIDNFMNGLRKTVISQAFSNDKTNYHQNPNYGVLKIAES